MDVLHADDSWNVSHSLFADAVHENVPVSESVVHVHGVQFKQY